MIIKMAVLDAGNKLAMISDSSTLEAEILLAHVLGKPRTYLYAHAEDVLSKEQLASFNALLMRRLQNEPIAYLVGHKEFWSLDLDVSADVLIPRPETELLVEEVLKVFPRTSRNLKLADLGAGSGAIALALASERPEWTVYAVDISQSALEIVRNNAQRLGIENISICHGNWFTALPAVKLDIVVSNPPYISRTEWEEYAKGLLYEPRQALLSGEDGLDDIREICRTVQAFLKPHGYLFLEHGFAQGEAVRALFVAAGFEQVHTIRDFSGHERLTVGRLEGGK